MILARLVKGFADALRWTDHTGELDLTLAEV